MISRTRPSFWRAYAALDERTREAARRAYGMFALNPNHPGRTDETEWRGFVRGPTECDHERKGLRGGAAAFCEKALPRPDGKPARSVNASSRRPGQQPALRFGALTRDRRREQLTHRARRCILPT